MYARKAIIAIGVIGILLGAPVVSAQKLDVDTQATKTSIPSLRPELDTEVVTLAWSYSFENTAMNPVGLGVSSATATITVDCDDPNILATGPQSKLVPLGEGASGQGTHDFSVQYFIAVTRDLPGLKQFNCEYSATVGAINPSGTAAEIPESNPAGAKFLVSAKFFGLVQAKVPTQIKQAGPQKEVPFEIQFDNFGNARTQIQFAVDERPGSDKWSAVLPGDVILDSPASGGAKTSDTATITIQTPHKNGWNNEQGNYRIRMTTFAAEDPEQTGIDLTSNILIRVRGVYVPTLEPLVMMGAVLGSGALLRMRRE